MHGSVVWRLVIPKERISSEKVICKMRRTRSKRERKWMKDIGGL